MNTKVVEGSGNDLKPFGFGFNLFSIAVVPGMLTKTRSNAFA